ncbi:MAG TPA: S8 family serine peptidase [Solirubrobacteraceae bacterium]
MNGIRAKVVLAFLLGCLGLPSSALAASISPLGRSNYLVRRVCAVTAPGRAHCLGLELRARTASARARERPLGMTRPVAITAALPSEGAYGLRPADLRGVYFPGEEPDAPASQPQTIALVDAYNDPAAEAGLQIYDREFHLPECTTANGCFGQVNQNGETGNLPFPKNSGELEAKQAFCNRSGEGESSSESEHKSEACREVHEAQDWALEISSDIELTHGVCENCRIRLIEADAPQATDLEIAEQTAARPQSEGGIGADEISNSWGVPEPPLDSEAFNHPGVVITAASGDFGYLNWTEAQAAAEHGESYYQGVEYPAASPHVIAVGGTKLLLGSDGARQSETVWNEDLAGAAKNEGADGGGCSVNFDAPSWQQTLPDFTAVGCTRASRAKRALTDVSADGDPYTGMATYYAAPQGAGSWRTFGGTSISAPIIAAMFALAGGAHGVAYPAQTLYSHLGSPLFYDITEGGDGRCDGDYSSGCSGSLSPLSPLDCGAGALICNAAAGYDGPSGVGSPNRLAALAPTGTKTGLQPEPGPQTQHANEQPQGSSPGVRGAAQPPPRHAPAEIDVLDLALSSGARGAIARGWPAVSSLAFSFTLSAPALVRVGLAKLVHRHGHSRWQVLRDALSMLAVTGLNHVRLRAPGRLAPGLYRLRLRPVGGRPRSLLVTVRSNVPE